MNNVTETAGGSLADRVFERLERDILSGELAENTQLSENMLSKKLGVSRTPVREALRRLEQEGLVSSETGRGTVVLGVNRDDLCDIFEIRIKLEGMAAARAAAVITDEQLAELERVADLQQFYLSKGDPESISDADSRFHQLIYRYSSSRVLEDVLGSLHHRIQRFRRLSMESPERAERSVSEHRAILDALRGHDPGLAESMLSEHIQNARDSMLEQL